MLSLDSRQLIRYKQLAVILMILLQLRKYYFTVYNRKSGSTTKYSVRFLQILKSNQIKSNGLLCIAALMLDDNNIEVMCLPLITLRIVSVDNTIAVTKITSIYTKMQKHEFKTTKINSDKKVQETITWISRQTIAL